MLHTGSCATDLKPAVCSIRGRCLSHTSLTTRFGASGVCGQGTAVKMADRARRADFSLSSGLSSNFRLASLCSFFCAGGFPAADTFRVSQNTTVLMGMPLFIVISEPGVHQSTGASSLDPREYADSQSPPAGLTCRLIRSWGRVRLFRSVRRSCFHHPAQRRDG